MMRWFLVLGSICFFYVLTFAIVPDAGLFLDASESGLNFTHFNGATGDYYIPEILGSGVALFDYDGDGDLDVLLIQGGLTLPSQQIKDAKFPPPSGSLRGVRLYRN